jgi:hypothetical protein
MTFGETHWPILSGRKIMETLLVEADEILEPSVETIMVTYEYLSNSVKKISEESKAILETVMLVGDLLDKVSGATDTKGVLDGLGLMAIPIPLAMKAVFLALNNYIEQKTDISLKSWMSFVNSTQSEFEEYLTQLETVAEQAKVNKKLLENQDVLNVEQLRGNQNLLEKTKVKTKLWRPVLAQTTKLNELIDSMLAAKEQIDNDPQEETRTRALPKNFIKKVGDSVKDLATNERPKLLDFVFEQISNLKNRISHLNVQISKLSSLIFELEDLLDLEIAQIKAMLGEIPPKEASVLGTRVAITILIPRIREQFIETQRKVKEYEFFLQRLQSAYQAGKVSDTIYKNLSSEYQEKLEQMNIELNTLKREANAWKSGRAPAVDMGVKWLKEELELVKTRELVGELPESLAEQRRKALEREIDRFYQANQLLSSQAW